ncbi:hypothetical protein CCP4SC76_7800003 [Gammaproteobacteria bacterium]
MSGNLENSEFPDTICPTLEDVPFPETAHPLGLIDTMIAKRLHSNLHYISFLLEVLSLIRLRSARDC